ncbi:MAG TPA: GLPGLI family protein [Chitinophagaceae bacterium]|nr:GLPGLI family protein [Chitinophagaceae bacterium]
MKKIKILPLFLFLGIAVTAQTKEGRVVYERTIQMRLQGVSEEVAAQMPRSRTDVFELLFGNNQSLWQNLPTANEEQQNTFSGAGGTVVVRQQFTNEVTHYNFATGKRVDLREVGDKNYLVDDSVRKLAWKITDETKTILGHTARKATAQRIGTRPMVSMENGEMKRTEVADTASIIAWFTTDVPVPAGPEFGGQLPGLILELDMNKGRMVYKAIELSPKVKLDAIKEPKGGKHITQAQYDAERLKMLDQMRRNMPAGAQIRVGN